MTSIYDKYHQNPNVFFEQADSFTDGEFCIVFCFACQNKNYQFARRLYETKNNMMSLVTVGLFSIVCEYGDLEFAKWLLSLRPDFATKDASYRFWKTCAMGHLHVVKWLYEVTPKTCGADVLDIKRAFKTACVIRNLELAKYLFEINESIHILDCVR